jgi:hypothetical protein
VLGEEQICDVDLDRSLVDLPLRLSDSFPLPKKSTPPPPVSLDGSSGLIPDPQPRGLGIQFNLKLLLTGMQTLSTTSGLFYLIFLLLPKVSPRASIPLWVSLFTISENKKRRHPPRLPYTLFPRLDDLLAIPVGRRKAIEVNTHFDCWIYKLLC